MKQSRARKKNPQTSAEKGKIKVTQNAQGQGRNSVLNCDYSFNLSWEHKLRTYYVQGCWGRGGGWAWSSPTTGRR